MSGPDKALPADPPLSSAALLDSIQEAYFAVDPGGVIRGFNRAARELLGFTTSEVYEHHLDETLSPECDGEPIAPALERLFAAGPARPVVRELTVRHHDGHRVTTRASLSVAQGTSGALACVFLTDLSAEVTADRDAGFLTALLDSLSVGVIAVDDEGKVIVVNRALRQVQHRAPTDVPRAIPDYLYDTSMRPLTWEQTPVMRALRGEHVSGLDLMARAPDDRLLTFASAAQPIIGRDGRRLGGVAVAHEVTALRRAERFGSCRKDVEQALRASSSIAEAAPAVLSAVTAALGWPCAELFVINEATGGLHAVGHHSHTGAEPDELFGHTPRRGQGVTGRVWQTGEALWVPDVSAHADLVTPYEQERVEMCSRHGIRTALAVPVRDGGTLLGVLTCYSGLPEVDEELLTLLLDGVAAQIGVYVALRRAEELARQLRRSQDDFLDLIGHELRTPLTAITANVAMLTEEAVGLDPELRQMMDTVARNTGMLQRIVDALLDLAALESGHEQLADDRVDLAGVVAGAVTAIRLTAAEAGVRLSTDLPEHLMVPGDGPRLRQVVDDLLSNAVKYSPAGAEVSVGLRVAGPGAELHIADHGIGTPAGEQDQVFERFYRASNVRHHGVPGSGLGLSLARAIVRLHHGTITLAANEPVGTVVSVHLPFDPSPR
ncbi:PAS domain S-box-containing protein [Actinoplanes lutulentus]|uniref:histidine kinase n=1 Tax=Actinoplanes lutulentus TaxID=1287878 RepID=A0A327ZGC4_9ACTN|nr:PAS domain-containing sensor histidine kinase [Actinoplanes lutulentus]MBB2948393.1 PAS domain S-box-containing protein [Actinoplanes lutulentus]RAK34574.1 PAS domain S-box-containing protein [Actinoplanes lutulentus]